MKRIFRNISIFKKILFFSFTVILLVGVAIMLISGLIQNSREKKQFSSRLTEITTLASSIIDTDHVTKVLQSETADNSSYEKLTDEIFLITKKTSPSFYAEIVLLKNEKPFAIIPPENRNVTPFTFYSVSDEYIDALSCTSETKDVSYSEIYRKNDISWLTAFSPIQDENGEIIAILGINADITVFQSQERKLYVYYILTFIIIMIFAYWLLRRGLKKSLCPIIEEAEVLKERQRIEKLNAIGQLAASVAHEIRNPMTVVKGFLQIFLAKEKLTREEHMYVKLMIDEMSRAETIINDYLSLAKPDIQKNEKVNGRNLAYKVMDLIHSYAMMSKNIELRTIVEDEFSVRGNKSELQQVLINILKNGIEAMKGGGLLTLKAYKKSIFGIFEIHDTGIGMTKEEVKKLGNAYYSLKEKGTGMGLLVSFQIIERMNGSITVESEKGKGTVFIISIPLDKEGLDEV